jgi:Flp pilus assembly protein TadG
MKPGLPRKEKGAAAIEFALVFVAFFAVFYGVVSYSLPLLLMQLFNHSTAEAVRRSVALDPTVSPATYTQDVQNRALSVLSEQLAWVPSALKGSLNQQAVYSGGVLTVTVSLPASALSAIMPVLVLPGDITVPSLPTTLTAQSSLQF